MTAVILNQFLQDLSQWLLDNQNVTFDEMANEVQIRMENIPVANVKWEHWSWNNDNTNNILDAITYFREVSNSTAWIVQIHIDWISKGVAMSFGIISETIFQVGGQIEPNLNTVDTIPSAHPASEYSKLHNGQVTHYIDSKRKVNCRSNSSIPHRSPKPHHQSPKPCRQSPKPCRRPSKSYHSDNCDNNRQHHCCHSH